ncbi:MAG TPA: hypothetical protein VN381_12415 [Anaerovoracaceae bacterium]|nr:hypothetical protein [Anaerovoracaceae bacterium]
MRTLENRILRKSVATLLTLALILSGLFLYPVFSNAAGTKIITTPGSAEVTDLAYYDIWKHEDGTWQNGMHQGSSVSQRYTISEVDVPEGATIVSVTGEFDEGFDKDRYNDFCVLSADISGIDYEYDTGSVKQDSTAELSYTVSTALITRQGANGEDIKQPWQAPNVEGWRYYIPAIFYITYTITVEISVEPGDFELTLDVPETTKQGNEITVSTSSVVDDLDGMQYVKLERRFGSSGWKHLKTWTGDGTLGKDIGGSINNTLDDVGTYQYRTTGCDINGVIKTLIKSVTVDDNQEIIINAKLSLPQFTYEGHTEIAADESTFNVDGVNYSAARAYAENIASNSFKCSSSYVSISRLNNTKANATFFRTGIYTVNLHVRDANGQTGDDYGTIEVRKTPEILDNLSGFQKQNRKQILNITVATYPGKPLTGYSITLKDKKTGNSIVLTPGSPQVNNSTIKTRAVTMTQDIEKGFAYITLEFLTKTPAYNPSDPGYTQDFYYEIHVEDSKRDTDTASRTFTVTPDHPPAAAISLDSVFLRNEGTNTASIVAEDVTVATDGDSVARTWYYALGTAPTTFTNVASMDGYKKLSFGTDKIVGFNKVGVGKFTARLDVKEVWTEPTLEEYVTDADHLTGTTRAYSDVQNVAPIVSLELQEGIEQEILLLANNDSEYQTLLNNKTALQQALLANKVDGQIVIKKLVGSTPSTVTGVQQQRDLTFPYPAKLRGDGLATEVNESNLMAIDSERTYFLTYTWIDGNPTVPKTVHAINNFSSGEAWSYTTSRNEDFTYGQDDTGKYLYLIYKDSNQTVLLDKRTGTLAGTVNIALSDKVWLTDNLAFMIENGGLYAVDLNSLMKTRVSDGAAAVSRVGGNLQYIENTANAIVRCTLDMKTFELSRDILINIAPGASAPGNYIPACIDSTGKAVIFKNTGTGSDTFRGIKVISPKNAPVKDIPVPAPAPPPSPRTYSSKAYVALDEQGRCNHVFLYDSTGSNNDASYIRGMDINTGSVASVNSGRLTQPYAGAFQSGGTSYLMFEGWYIYPGGIDYRGLNYTFSFNGSSIGMDYSVPGVSGTPYAESIKVSDRALAEFNGDNTPQTGTFKMKIIGFPRTLAQETAEIVSRFAGKQTFRGDINTTADQIKAAGEAPKPTVKVTAANDGYISLSNLSLLPGKEYYYEYEIKPLVAGTESRLAGMSSVTPTATSDQSFLSDTLYVEKTYKADFNGGSINSFFTVVDGGLYKNGYYGIQRGEKDNEDTCAKLTFNVPSGKQAILQFDFWLYIDIGRGGGSICIDGESMIENFTANQIDTYGHCVFRRLLSSGAHTIEFIGGSYSPYIIMMDNLKADILSTAAPVLSSAQNTQEGKQKGWLDINGSFATPNRTISYGAQASTTYYGGIPMEVIGYDSKTGYANNFNYYQTVPAGYMQKGRLHFYVGYMRSYATLNIHGAGSIRAESGANEWVGLGVPKAAGTYTHNVIYGSSSSSNSAYIDLIDIVQYPDNAVTRTGNMAFDSSNTKYYFPKATSTGTTNLSIFMPQGEYLVRNLKLYYIENGKRIYLQNRDLDEVSDLTGWSLSSGLASSVYAEPKEEPDDGPIKIYKKGEKVLYNIFYDDYEEDPSKQQYWRYAHINWPPDGVHPDVGKALAAPIDRFYLSGKYTVTHWQLDNTQRTGTVGDATPYNKESNKVDLTFYVNGEGAAPWITYIKTNPAMVKENNAYTLAVGVDDAEKDTLTLETEVYRDGKSIFTHRRENLQANASGVYPETLIGGLPAAEVGVYQVICTVRDYSGVGIKSYKFTVVSEGKITGYVNHTDQWDENRKKYNLKRFREEVNRPMLLGDYLAMPTPRMRGTNVFWSGEKFLLRSETEGDPLRVDVRIQSVNGQGARVNTGYIAELANTGRQTPLGADLWEGSLWNNTMINRWGRKSPEPLYFIFTAYYDGGAVRISEAMVIVDSRTDYWQLHRLW